MNEEESHNQKKKEKRKVERRHVCCHCSKAFVFPNKLRYHIQAAHSLSHVCEHCNVRFDRFNELRTHVAFAHHIRYKCPVCAYSSNVKAELKKHVIVNHEDGVCCTIDGCNVTVAYRNLKRHIREAHSRRGNEEMVDHEFRHQKKQETDRLIKSVDLKCQDVRSVETRKFVPDSCSISSCDISKQSGPSRHEEGSSMGSVTEPLLRLSPTHSNQDMLVDEAQNLLSCPISGCNKRFRRAKELKRHKIRYHEVLTVAEEAVYKYVCKYPNCNRRFCTPAGLRQHSGCHGDGLLIKCDSCKKTFKNRAAFATHLRNYHLLSIRQVNLSPAFVSVAEKLDVSDQNEHDE